MKQALTELYNKYVLVLIDKVTGNAAIVCQKLYVLTFVNSGFIC